MENKLEMLTTTFKTGVVLELEKYQMGIKHGRSFFDLSEHFNLSVKVIKKILAYENFPLEIYIYLAKKMELNSLLKDFLSKI